MCVAQYLHSFHNSVHLVLSQTAKREFKLLCIIVGDRFDQNWTTRERQGKRVAVSRVRVYGRKNIFGFYRDRTLRRPGSLGSPDPPRARARISVKRRPKEPTFKIPRRCLLSPRCASPSFFLPAVALSSSFFLLSSLSPFPLATRIVDERGRRKTHNSGSLFVSPILSFTLISIYVRANDPESGLSCPLTRSSSSVARADSSHRTSINLSSKLGY